MSAYIASENEVRLALTDSVSSDGSVKPRLRYLILPMMDARAQYWVDLFEFDGIHQEFAKGKPSSCAARWKAGHEYHSLLGAPGTIVGFKEPLQIKRASPGSLGDWCYAADSVKVCLALADQAVDKLIAWGRRMATKGSGHGKETCPASRMPSFATRIRREIAHVDVQRLRDITHDQAAAAGLSCLTKDGGATYKYGIPDRDGLPGTDNTGWPWSEWEVDPRKALGKALRQRYRKIDQTDALWLWVYEVKPVAYEKQR